MNSISLYKNGVNIKVGVYLFKEGDFYIAYCPSLDLVGYSDTEHKAKEDFEFILQDWLQDQISHKTLNHDLVSHGWKLDKEGGREPMLDALPNKEAAKRVANLPEYTKTTMSAQLQYC